MKHAIAALMTVILLLAALPGAAFASNDIGFSSTLLNYAFSWYNQTPGIDSNGLLDGADFESSSDAQEEGLHTTTSFGVQAVLTSDGDFVEYTCEQYIFAASYFSSPIICIELLLDPSYYSGAVSELNYQLSSPQCTLDCFYQFEINNKTVGNVNYRDVVLFFVNESGMTAGYPSIRISYNGEAARFTALAMQVKGLRNGSTSDMTLSEILDLQTQIINTFNIAILADMIEDADASQVDLTNIETALTNIENYLSNLPDILDEIYYIEDILNDNYDLLDSIESAILNFYNYYVNIHQYSVFNSSNYASNMYDHLGNVKSSSYTDDLIFLRFLLGTNFNQSFTLKFQLIFNTILDYSDISIQYALRDGDSNIPNSNWNNDLIYNLIYANGRTYVYIYLPVERFQSSSNLFLKIQFSEPVYFYYSPSTYFRWIHEANKLKFYETVLFYLKYLINGNTSTDTSRIDTQTQQITQDAQTIDTFHSSGTTSVNQNIQNIDTSLYPITATNGLTYMKTYAGDLFTASNGFRIWFMFPLILAIAGLFLRWRTPK